MHGKALAFTTLVATSMWLGSSAMSLAQDSTVATDEFECDIIYIDEPVLAAHESGILKKVLAEGTVVQEGDVVAATDQEAAKLRRSAAWFQFKSSEKNANSDIRRRYAVANHKTAKAAFRQVQEANERSPRAVAQAELDRRQLEVDSTRLAIENADHEVAVAKEAVKKDEAEFDLATHIALRHSVKSPINGVVVERLKQVGEFVQAGEEVLKIVRLEKLRAVGHISVDQINPVDAKGRRVSIQVNIGGETRTVTGEVTFSDTPITMNEYDVWVEFDNFDDLAIRPGMEATMRFE